MSRKVMWYWLIKIYLKTKSRPLLVLIWPVVLRFFCSWCILSSCFPTNSSTRRLCRGAFLGIILPFTVRLFKIYLGNNSFIISHILLVHAFQLSFKALLYLVLAKQILRHSIGSISATWTRIITMMNLWSN